MNVTINKYGAGIPLVFFHGWGFNHQIWMPLIPMLSSVYQLILVDLPGFGQTPIMDWELFKYKLLNQLPKRFAIIGWSMGGLYATRLSLEAPQRVTHLLNICSSPYFLLDNSWPGVPKEVFTDFYYRLSQDPHTTLLEFIKLQSSKYRFQIELGELPTEEGLALGLHILDTWDFREQIKYCNLPICYMFGRLDPIVPIMTMRMMQEHYRNFNYIFFNRAAHMPFLSHMDLFIKELQGFIK